MPTVSKALRAATEKAVPSPVAVSTNPSFIGGGSGWAFGGGRDELSLYQSWSWSCIDLIAKGVASLPIAVTLPNEESVNGRSPVESDHWLRRLIEHPNPEIEPAQLWSLATKWLCLNGNAYLYAPTYGEAYPQELWPLPANRVTPVPGTGAKGEPLVKGYIYTKDGHRYAIDASEMLHWKTLDPSRDDRTSWYLGRSPLNAAIPAIEIDLRAQAHLNKRMENDALPAYVITVPATQQVTPEDWQRFKGQWDETFMGSNKAGRWGLLDGGKQIQTLQATGQVEEVTKLDDSNRKRICAVWNVPEFALTGDANSRATQEANNAAVDVRAVQPRAKLLGQAFTRFARHYEPEADTVVTFLPYPYTDPEERRKERESWIKAGVPLNIVRAEEGLEPIPQEDEPNPLVQTVGGVNALIDLQLQVGSGTVPVSSAVAIAVDVFGLEPAVAARLFKAPEPSTEPVNESPAKILAGKAKALDTDREAAFTAYWKRYDDIAEDGTDDIEAALQGAFELLGDFIIGELRGDESGDEKRIELPADLFDLDEWKELFREETDPELRRLIIEVARQAFSDVGAAYNDLRGEFSRRVGSVIETSASRITEPVETIKKELTELLQKNRRRPVSEVKDLIRKQFKQYGESRARTIARTTATAATGGAQKTAWQTLESSDETIERIDNVWLSQRDGRVRRSHSDADGQVADTEGNFRVGSDTMQHPGGGGQARENANCRCVMRPRIVRSR